ncbi:MAG: copper-translocating P-type ATPase [Candidatus Cloacimonetes bacterium]|nr:copper-translocating P-type ATPase [Candidatus Cloacimonadota bacterium]MCF7814962.1 copper-translocating P-type ATPase [Candidatus Cloacimonadota bacterium]MCF7868423.1 copper-translocating P-type ATPase [Candidatus Cloacimonadota bacterium]MCF7883896.1 copper-translocating P-type ATPase [Candidatus Cloacimonadota bacterium]
MDHQNHSQSKHQHHDHSQHHQMMIKDFRKRFWISLIGTIPILILSPFVQNILQYKFEFAFANYLLFAFSGFIYFFGGWPFLTGLFKELKKKQPGMMTLIGVAITVAFGYSSATSFGLEGKTFFWELATLIDIMLLGHWIEMKSVVNASSSLKKLIELMPTDAHLIKENSIKDVKISDLNQDDIVLVRPGEKIPVDGLITEGKSHVNEAMVTGESEPVKKTENEKVIAGTINGNGSLKVKVQQLGEEAYLSKVITLVKEAQSKKSKTQHLADKIAFWLTLTSLSIGSITLIVWLSLGKSFGFALERMASVMVITCPHALGLAVPLVVAISTSISAQNGLLIRNRSAFENSRKITMFLFDKTGTLTKGNFGVTHYSSLSEKYEDKQILRFAGAVETQSEHPLASGIIQKVKSENIDLPEISDFNSITGKGIEANVEENNVKIVGPAYLKDNDIDIPQETENDELETIVFTIINDELAGYLALSDEIRPESYDAVKTLQKTGMKVYIISGDNEKVVKGVSEKLKLDGYFAGMLPEQKLEKIKQFQEEGEFVAMTGDGINDAPALATADIGIAVGSGTDVAAETADIILVNSNPKDITSLVLFGKETYKKMIQNFVWATGYNVVAIPLAAGVFYNAGIVISPALGAILMSLSTIVVAINAQLLKRKLK